MTSEEKVRAVYSSVELCGAMNEIRILDERGTAIVCFHDWGTAARWTGTQTVLREWLSQQLVQEHGPVVSRWLRQQLLAVERGTRAGLA